MCGLDGILVNAWHRILNICVPKPWNLDEILVNKGNIDGVLKIGLGNWLIDI